MKRTGIWVALLLALFLIACGPPPTPDPETVAATEEAIAAVTAEAEAEIAAATAESAAATAEVVMATAEAEATANAPAAEAPAEEAPAPTGPPRDIEHAVVEEGTGEAPQPGDFLQVHFIGRLEDGTEFLNSYEIGEPIVFPFGQGLFFPGWDTAIGMMTYGETAEIMVPSELAFGPQGAPPAIPPNADLYFEMEILADKLDIDVEILEEGSGPQPQPGDTVRVHYTGTLEDGTEFDSSRGGDPFEFVLGVGMVIPGWDIGIGRLAEGSRAILTIPSALAYGAQGAPPTIPPNATLTFDVELVAVNP